LQAALAQRLLARARPARLLGADPLAIAVRRGSPIRNVAQLVAQLRSAPQARVFATTGENWATDDLAALVDGAGVDGVVPYLVYPSSEEAALALAAGAAEVLLAPRTAIAAQVRAGALRELAWSAGARRPAPFWVALVAAPGVAPGRRVRAPGPARLLRREMASMAGLQQVALRLERH
jgi:tripartite-type tricarboxylate transporter receptor subunit TctC